MHTQSESEVKGRESLQGLFKTLEAIELGRRPVYKIFFSTLEGLFGHIFYRKGPPTLTSEKQYLHLGCGDHHFPGWVNADFYRFSDMLRKNRGLPDWMLDAGRPWNCEPNVWDGIYTEHTLEHLNYRAAINALQESYRTLKSGKWLRVVLPGVKEFLAHSSFHYRSEAMAHLTQTHGHVSVWDAEMMSDLLREIGFVKVQQQCFGSGGDMDLVKDLPERRLESFYVEGCKP
jgi:predicted SAM-dependent methyltransferase